MKDLSIIVVSYKGWERLLKCLDSLNSFKGDQFSSEVIVVDNNSSDGTIDEIEKRFPGFKFIHNPVNGGFGNGCNIGANVAAGEYLLFLNPDTVAPESETGKLLEAAKGNPGFYMLSCRQVNEKGKESLAINQFPRFWNLTGFQRTIAKVFRIKSTLSINEIEFPDWVSGSVMMIKKEIFQSINGFDDDFWMYYEDVDICKRINEIGGKVTLFRNISIEHNHGGSSRINVKTASITKTEVLISKHLYMSKHKSGEEKYLIQLFLVINNLVFGIILAILGVIFFFIPKIHVKTLIFLRLLAYYSGALYRKSWRGPRSVNSK
jgi:GT2 family glycosyltransferase